MCGRTRFTMQISAIETLLTSGPVCASGNDAEAVELL